MVFEHTGSFRSLRSGLTLLVAPFQNLVAWPVDVVQWLESSMSSQHKLRMENAVLRSNQLLLKAKLQKSQALEKENEQLKALLLSSAQVEGKMVGAELIAVDLAPFTQQVLLDKGSREKVVVGQPVLDANGVMGHVTAIGPTSSRVLLITDPGSTVPVQNNRNGVRAFAKGNGYDQTLKLLYVPDTADFSKGDLLVTSGFGGVYPVGYPVGTIEDVSHKAGEKFAQITVKPVAKLNQSRQVLLVWPSKHQVDVDAKPSTPHTKIKLFGSRS